MHEISEGIRIPGARSMLSKALSKLKGRADAPLLHSDQGWHYQLLACRKQLCDRGLTQCLSRKGNRPDNAAMESSFGTIRSGFFLLDKFANIEGLHAGLRRCIHHHNPQRTKTQTEWPAHAAALDRAGLCTDRSYRGHCCNACGRGLLVDSGTWI